MSLLAIKPKGYTQDIVNIATGSLRLKKFDLIVNKVDHLITVNMNTKCTHDQLL